MGSMTFLINDSSTGGNVPVVQVTITENPDGTLTFTLTQLAGYVGDLRGLFFDVADESLISTLTAVGVGLTELQQGNDTINDLGGGANMNGLLGDSGGYDVGVEIGTSGLKTTDDIRTFTFTLDSTARDLTLADFSSVAFGARVTSVGLDSNLDGAFETSRSGSSKTGEMTFAVISPTKDCAAVDEDATTTGNVLANDGAAASDVLTVTGWSGGVLGDEYAFTELAFTKITLNANGSYTIDASAADALAAGESVSHTFTYDVLQTNVDGTSTHTVSFKVTITGTNDAPTISVADDAGAVTEDATDPTLSDSGTITFDDIDLTDAHTASVSKDSGTLGGSLVAVVSDVATGAGDGTVTWTYSVANSATQYLGVGDTATETFTVTIDDGETGGTVSQLVTVTVTGTNDAPTISVADDAGAVTEDATDPTLSDSGTITFDDIDLTDAHTASVSKDSGTLGGSLVAVVSDVATGAGDGTVTWTYSVANSATQYLGVGDTATETFTVTIDDGETGGTVSQLVTVTVTGTNDAPTISVADDAGAVTEDATDPTLSDSGTITFDDIDLTDAHTASVSKDSGTLGGSLVAVVSDVATGAGDGTVTWTYSVANSATQYLGVGDTATETFTVTIDDGETGGTVSQLVTVTVTGTNDAPTISVADDAGAVTEDATDPTLSDSGTITFDDIDLTDAHTASVSKDSGTLGGSLVAVVSDVATGAGDGTVTWTYSVANSATQYLGVGDTATETFTVTIDDGETGGTVSQLVTVTVTGTNDAPVVAVADVTGVVTEATTPVGNLTDTGTIAFTDVDLTDVHSLSAVTPSVGALGSLTAGVSADTTGSGTGGVISWSYSVAASAVEYLAAGQTKVETFSFNVLDGEGGSVPRTVSVTITGTNDAPVVAVADVTGAVTEAITPAGNLTDTGTIAFSDVDLNDIHSVSAVTPSGGALGTLTAGVSADTTGNGLGGVVTWNYSVAASAVEYLAAGQTKVETFSFNVLDGQGGSVARTVSVTITGTNDAPDIRVVSGDSATSTIAETNTSLAATGTLTVNDADVSDSVTLSVASVVASGTTAGLTSSNAALQAMLSLVPTLSTADPGAVNNLTWNFNSGSQAFDHLAAGQTLTLTYSLSGTDGTAADTQSVTVNITGTNDAATDLIFSVTNSPGNSLPNGAFGQMSVIDPDGGAGAYTYSLTGLTATTLAGGAAGGFAGDLIVSSTGAVSASGLDDDRVYELTVQVAQGAATFSETFSIITGTNAGNNINGAYVSGDDVIFARGDTDTILAGSGNDTVFGQAADDQIHGGTGNDVLTGGGGDDTFYFNETLDASTNVDTITDFDASNNDKIALDQTIFTMLTVAGPLAAANFRANAGGVAVDANDYVLYDTGTGNLYYDVDGNGAGAKVLFASLTLSGVTPTVDAADFIVIP